MRLTADLINSSLSYLNPLKERELDLRGHKIPLLENLAAPAVLTVDALDLTDNVIPALSNLPLLPRLRTLLLARNRIASIHPSIGTILPGLTTLVLAENRLTDLAELDNLRACRHLTHLVLAGNEVARKPDLRAWIAARCPAVRFLDYQKITAAERAHAREQFGTLEAPTAQAQKMLGSKKTGAGARTFDVPDDADAVGGGNAAGAGMRRVKLTGRERQRVQEMLLKAKSMAEITRLERELNEGRVPGGVVAEDEEMEG